MPGQQVVSKCIQHAGFTAFVRPGDAAASWSPAGSAVKAAGNGALMSEQLITRAVLTGTSERLLQNRTHCHWRFQSRRGGWWP